MRNNTVSIYIKLEIKLYLPSLSVMCNCVLLPLLEPEKSSHAVSKVVYVTSLLNIHESIQLSTLEKFSYLQISFMFKSFFFLFLFVCCFIQSQVIYMPMGNKVTGLKEHYDN